MVFDLSRESSSTLEAYGVKPGDKTSFAWQCLMARRMVERSIGNSHGGESFQIGAPVVKELYPIRRRIRHRPATGATGGGAMFRARDAGWGLKLAGSRAGSAEGAKKESPVVEELDAVIAGVNDAEARDAAVGPAGRGMGDA